MRDAAASASDYPEVMSLPPLVEPVAALTAAERERSARHMILAGIGELGQRRLAAARIAVVGAGGLGSPVILALAAAGVGTLIVIDDDTVELSNLQRQVIHRREDAGALKTDSATRVAAGLSDTVVVPVPQRLTPENAATLLAAADLVIDGSDLFATREAVAAGTEKLGIPLVWGTVQQYDAQVTVFWSRPPLGAAPVVLADLYPPGSVGTVPTCADVGVLGALCLQVGSLLALEAIKLVTGIGEPLLGRVLLIDGLRARQTEVPLRAADPRASEPAAAHGATPDAASMGTAMDAAAEISAEAMLAAQRDGATLLDVREPWEVANGVIAGSVPIPLAEVLADPDRVPDGPVVVVCARGFRARSAADALTAHGREASVLAGGLAAWPELPTVVPAGATA